MSWGIRVAFFGDSWVSEWDSHDYWKLQSPMPEAVRRGLEQSWGCSVEMVVCGFPGVTAWRSLELARICRLQDMALIHSKRGNHLPRQGSYALSPLLRRFGVRHSTDGWLADEEVDVVILMAGYNDILYDEGAPASVAKTLFELRDLYESRGVTVLIASVNQGELSVEKQRLELNELIAAGGPPSSVLDIDRIVNGHLSDRKMWKNQGHLTHTGQQLFGLELAESVVDVLRPQWQAAAL